MENVSIYTDNADVPYRLRMHALYESLFGCSLVVIDAATVRLPLRWQTLAGQKAVAWHSRALRIMLSWSGQPLGSWGWPPGLTQDKTQHHSSSSVSVSLLTLEPGAKPVSWQDRLPQQNCLKVFFQFVTESENIIVYDLIQLSRCFTVTHRLPSYISKE